jgi:hypothetical protein
LIKHASLPSPTAPGQKPLTSMNAAITTQPVAVATKPDREFATISGSAWITRNNGASDLLRGLTIYLVKPSAGPVLPLFGSRLSVID